MKSKLPFIEESIFTKMSALANEYDAINLSQGFPNFSIDEKLKDFVKEGLDKEQIQYAPLAGRKELLFSLQQKLEQLHDLSLDPLEEITITAGATQAIYSAISSVIHAGDEVILFDPSYDCYGPSILYNNGIPIHLKLDYPNFCINWSVVRKTITENTKLIIVNNPHNPSGSIWSQGDLTELESILRDFPNIFVLSDEVYEHIQYKGKHQSVLANKFIRQRSFAVYSFGKTFHVTGWKVGYCVAPPALTEEFRKHHQFNVFCVNNTIQYALHLYIDSGINWTDLTNSYRERKALFLKHLKSSRFKILPCEGTYFCLLDYSSISAEKDTTFVEKLVREKGVALLPISVFYNDQTDNKLVRVCFAKNDRTLIEGAKKLCAI